ncbi:hypothetical protein KCP75_14475 [Salmonella enterica subsp. enterica]|nr:hypothetical protein KCP75_14475 [Salmonella enterica subsp. enterica]
MRAIPVENAERMTQAMEKIPTAWLALAPWLAADWMKSALLAQKANVDPHKMRYAAFSVRRAGDGINGQPCLG